MIFVCASMNLVDNGIIKILFAFSVHLTNIERKFNIYLL